MSDFEYSENTKKLIDSNPFDWKADLEATITGYQSPITMIAQEIETKVENDCVKAVQRYGFDVDAKELYKALNYDREQYQKGYADAKRDYARPHGEWIEESSETGALGIKYTWVKCNQCGWNSSLVIPKNYCPNCGADMRKEASDE
jgi:rubrerythrin